MSVLEAGTLSELLAVQSALNKLHTELKANKLLTNDIEVIFHNHYNQVTESINKLK